jgi:hypothetical protein
LWLAAQKGITLTDTPIDLIARRGQVLPMPPRPNSLPRPPFGGGADFSSLVRNPAGLTPAELRVKFEDAKRQVDEGYGNYEVIVTKIVDDMVGLLKQGHKVDIEPLVDNFRRDEVEAQQQARQAEKLASEALRVSAAKLPELIAVLNWGLSQELTNIERLATLYRDARWKLMTARALYQPSNPKGRIHGLPTDGDDYLKTLG